VSGGGSADSMLQFQLKREGDGMKHRQKMKRRQRTHSELIFTPWKGSMTWHAVVWRRRSEERRHQGGDDAIWANTNLTVPKNE
jgi:hypothetical protein